jgi:AbiV family abortive infection protein
MPSWQQWVDKEGESSMASPTPMLTAEDLLHGMIYSLEHCGLLLHGARTLYPARAYASAIGLAALAWEALGQSRFLREKRQELMASGEHHLPLQDIEALWGQRGHEIKQQYGQASGLQLSSTPMRLGRLVQATMENPPDSPAFQQAQQELTDATNAEKKRIPVQRSRQREHAFYVDFDKDTHRWRRPKEISREAAKAFIHDAIDDYAGQYDRFQGCLPILQIIDAELFQALQAWSSRPVLPEPPEFPRPPASMSTLPVPLALPRLYMQGRGVALLS